MSLSKEAQIVDRLIKSTEAGLVTWEATTSENTYEVSMPDYTIRLRNTPTYYEQYDDYVRSFHIEFVNNKGKVLLSVSDDSLTPELGDAHTKLSNLFDLILRRVEGVDQALDDILKNLPAIDEGGDIPF